MEACERTSLRGLFIVLSLYFLFVAVELISILLLNDGIFTYILDDAYIHLSLAQQIAAGHYGINPGENSSPASSIIWPFILSCFAYLPRFELVPLVLNIISGALTAAVIWRFITFCLRNEEFPGKKGIVIFLTILLSALGNLIILVFTGMEHSLQVLLSVLLVFGLVVFEEKGEMPWWFPCLLIVGPAVRYENLALSVPVAFYLMAKGEFNSGAVSLAGIAGVVGGFSLFLRGITGDFLPWSVIAKTGETLPALSINGILSNIADNISNRQGLIIVLVSMLILFSGIFKRRDKIKFCLTAISSAALHIVFGEFNFLMRYGSYLWLSLILVAIYLWSGVIEKLFPGKAQFPEETAKVFGVLTVCLLLTAVAFLIPVASSNIYHQQFQMRRFAVDYLKAPCGINDLGLVSFNNPNYVLDYGGLASRRALEGRAGKLGENWMEVLAEEHDVNLIMIYKKEYPDIPERWIHLGTLTFSGIITTPAYREVDFYARKKASAGELRSLVAAFNKTLPEGAAFKF